MFGLGILQDDGKLWPIDDLVERIEEKVPRYYLGIPTRDGSLSTRSPTEFLNFLPQALENMPESNAAGRVELLVTLCRAWPEEISVAIMENQEVSLVGHVKQAIAWTGESHPFYRELLCMLATFLTDRYIKSVVTAANVQERLKLQVKEMPDLEEALKLREKALAMTPKDDAKWILRLNGVTKSLLEKAQWTNASQDLCAVESNARKVADMVPEGHPDRSEVLWQLGDVLDILDYRSTEDRFPESYFDEATKLLLRALPLTKANKSARAWGMKWRLIRRYEDTGRIAYLDEVIRFRQEYDTDDGEEKGSLSEIGALFMIRYLRTGAMSDLDEFIRRMERTMANGEDRYGMRTDWANSLAAGYGYRYAITRVESDIRRSIDLLRDNQKTISRRQSARYEFVESWRNQVECALHLANQLESRFRISKSMRDLDEAIEIDNNIIHQLWFREDNDMHDKQRGLAQYAIRLLKRYCIQKSAADLTNAEKICHQAVNAEENGINLSFALCALGDVFYQRHLDGKSPDALRTASSAYEDGFSKENSSPQHRDT